jgi:hypothetical protein
VDQIVLGVFGNSPAPSQLNSPMVFISGPDSSISSQMALISGSESRENDDSQGPAFIHWPEMMDNDNGSQR